MNTGRQGSGSVGRGIGLLLILAFVLGGAFSVRAADNSACLKCHQNPRLSKGNPDGSLLSLYVNEVAFRASVHGEAGIGCTDCHQDAQPDVHPAAGFPEAGCANCHAEAAEAYKKTLHGMAAESGLERAPKCKNCHTAHSIRKIGDPQSPVGSSRLAKVCASCHEEARPGKGFLAALATYRFTGHPKVNLNTKFGLQVCSNCHPENAGHPQKPQATSCQKCHERPAAGPLLLGPIHSRISFADQPVPYILRLLYGAGLIILIGGSLVFFSFRTYWRRKSKEDAPQDPGT